MDTYNALKIKGEVHPLTTEQVDILKQIVTGTLRVASMQPQRSGGDVRMTYPSHTDHYRYIQFRAPKHWKYLVITKPIDTACGWRSQTPFKTYEAALRWFHMVPHTKDAMLLRHRDGDEKEHTLLGVK